MSDPETIEADIRRRMHQHAQLKGAADRGSSAARRDRRVLHIEIDDLFDRYQLAALDFEPEAA